MRSPSNPGGTGGAGKGFVLERAEGYSRILKVQLVQPVSLEAFDDVPLVPFLFQQFNLFGLYRESLHRCSSSSKSENKTVVEMTSSFACLCIFGIKHEQGAHDVSEYLRIVSAQRRAVTCSPGEN